MTLDAAIEWVQRNRLGLPIDPTSVGIWGHSAGGHLAAMTGLQSGSPIRAVATISGPAEFLDPAIAKHVTARSAITQLIGGTLATHRDVFMAASPVFHTRSDSPPFLIIHGTADETVPFSQAQRLQGALVLANGMVDLVPIVGGHHNMQGDPDAPYYAPVWFDIGQRVAAFFRRNLYPHDLPT
jgi:dipeptidyl aminopeptidase/acylaminoacyl peptidase